MQTHIYTTVSSEEIRRGDRWYGYVITAEGHSRKLQRIGIIEGTYHQASLKAITEALDRFNPEVPCKIEIHCEDKFVAYHAVNSLEQNWQFCGWKNSKGQPIANQKLWERLYNMMQVCGHQITWVKGRHRYSEHLRQAMKEAEYPKREMPL